MLAVPGWALGRSLFDRDSAGRSRALRAEERSAVEDFFLELLEVEINHRGYEKSNELGDDQTTDDDQTQRLTRSAVGAEPESDRQGAKNRSEGRHQDRPEAVHAGIVNRLFGRLAGSHPVESEIDNHDAVLFDDTHQHEHPDKSVERGLLAEQV